MDRARGGWSILLAVGVWTLLALVGLSAASAQRAPEVLSRAYRSGLQAYQQERFEQASADLRSVVRLDFAFIGSAGAAAYWLGNTYAASGQPDSMRWAWRSGVRALREADRFDARLFDAHLRAQLQTDTDLSADRQRHLASVYLDLLRHVGRGPSAEAQAILHTHVAQLQPLLGEEALESILRRGTPDDPETWAFNASASDRLLAWWERHDPAPATSLNERVVEHLQRVSAATEEFGSDQTLRGWDARGDVYVRLGAPRRRVRVPFDDTRFLREVLRSGVPITRADFPDNEIWAYPDVAETGRYLFVERNGAYTLGTLPDLLPRTLRGPFGSARRHQNWAYSSMAALRHIYDHLAISYHDMGNVSSRIAGWFEFQRSAQSLSGLGQRGRRSRGGMVVGDGSGARRVFRGPGPSQSLPSTAAASTMGQVTEQEHHFAHRRQQEVPTQRSTRSPSLDLPVAVRTARFRTPSGGTRTDIYWALPTDREGLADGLGLDAEDLRSPVLTAAAVRYDTSYVRHNAPRADTTVVGAQQPLSSVHGTIRLGATRDPFHLALQWDQYRPSDSVRGLGSSLRRTVRWQQEVAPLDADPSRLAMSDLKPMVLEGAADAADLEAAATLHPDSTLSTNATLLLVFEVYDLQRGSDERTRWTVEYTTTRTVRKGFLGRLFGEDEERVQTSTSTPASGTRASSREVIAVDLGQQDDVEPGALTVTLRVTDETSGQTTGRTIRYQLVDPDGS